MSTFILSGNTSDFTTCHHSVNLDPNKKYEAALLSLDTYNSIPKIMYYHIQRIIRKLGKPLLSALVHMN